MKRYSIFMDRKSHIVKISVLPNLIYRFNVIPIKISASYFVDIDKLILKLIRRSKTSRIANTLSNQKNKVRGLTLPDFKTVIKVVFITTINVIKFTE